MSAEVFNGHTISGTAQSAITKYRFARVVSTAKENQLVDVAGAGEAAIGVFIDTYASGVEASLATDGTGKLNVDGSGTAIVAGTRLKPNASGIGIATTAGDYFAAISLEPSSAAGELNRVIIEYGYHGA